MQIITAFFQPSPTKKAVKPISLQNFCMAVPMSKSAAIAGVATRNIRASTPRN